MQIVSKSIVERLNEYIKLADPGWLTKLKPANEKDIEFLKKYVGLTNENLNMMDSFIEFARYAGEGDSGLISSILKGKFSIKDLVQRNAEIYGILPKDINSNEFEFLTDEVGMDYMIELKEGGRIFYEDTCYISSSFEHLLFQCSIRKYEEMFYKDNIYFGSSIQSFQESRKRRKDDTLSCIMQRLVEEYDLQTPWFNDEYFFYAYGKGFSIFLLKRVAVAGKIMGDNIFQIQHILKKVLPIIGACIQKN